MGKYDAQFALMTWSYSRLTQFETCRYAWKLKYLDGLEGRPLFFSQFGSFMHQIMELYLTDQLKKSELESYYLSNFLIHVDQRAPNIKVFQTYFQSGLQYLQNGATFPWNNIIAVEKKLDFKIGSNYFTGIIDAIDLTDNQLTIIDHKSRTLKPFSGKAKPTGSDKELDLFLRQLYLYSAALYQQDGNFPDYLAYNTFRQSGQIIVPFSRDKYEQTLSWADSTIHTIKTNANWSPTVEQFKCFNLCDMNTHCEYCRLMRSGALVKS